MYALHSDGHGKTVRMSLLSCPHLIVTRRLCSVKVTSFVCVLKNMLVFILIDFFESLLESYRQYMEQRIYWTHIASSPLQLRSKAHVSHQIFVFFQLFNETLQCTRHELLQWAQRKAKFPTQSLLAASQLDVSFAQVRPNIWARLSHADPIFLGKSLVAQRCSEWHEPQALAARRGIFLCQPRAKVRCSTPSQ